MTAISMKNRIRVLRFEKHMTQEELAVRVGVSRQTIMSIENGSTNPSVLLAFKIAMALEMPIVDVFAVEGKLIPV
jgi:putative transcriptional regulator